MVNSSKSPASAGAGASGGIAGAGNSPGGSIAGGGSAIGLPASVIPASVIPRNDFRDEIATLADGIEKQLLDGVTYVVAGVSITKPGILSVIETVEGLYAAVDAGVQSLKQERLALKAALPGVRQFIDNLKALLVGLFGKGNPVLESFGIVRGKKALTVEQKVARNVKALETRKQRGTGGKRQKAAIKFTGSVDVQAHVAGIQAAPPAAGGGIPSSAGAPTPGAPPSGGNTAGSGPSQP